MKKVAFALALGVGMALAGNTKVSSYYGSYDVKTKKAGEVATSLVGPQKENYSFETKANKPYKIAVLFPHLKDSYWLAVNYGILQEANRLGVKFELFEVKGYNNLGKQKKVLSEITNANYDGVLLGSISYDKLNGVIEKSKVPVVEIINDIEAGDISAKSLVSFFTMGYKAGEYTIANAKGDNKTVAFLPGPKNSGWADDTYYGFLKAIEDKGAKNLTVYAPLFGDTDAKTQATLIKRAFAKYKNIDYVVGNAVAASVAPKVLSSLEQNRTKVVSTYIIPEVYTLIQQGKVAAAPSDMTVTQGRVGVDMLVKILNGKKAGVDFGFRVGPNIPVVTKSNLLAYESMFGSKDFKAVFSN